MNVTCLKCLQNTALRLCPVFEKFEDLTPTGINVQIARRICNGCRATVALQTFLSPQWKSIKDCLVSDKNLKGWHTVNGPEVALILYILTNIYNESASDTDPIFDMPDILSHARIFWKTGLAIAYYTAKPKGTLVHSTYEIYGAHTLDTAFVLPAYRRMGLGISMLQDMAESRPGEDLAISSPISKSMAHVIYKFLEERPDYRMKLWEIEGAGSHGNRKLLQFTLGKRLIS